MRPKTPLPSRAPSPSTPPPPRVTISSGPADGSTTNDPTPTFRFSPTEPGSSFQCRYEGHGFSACSGAGSDTAASPLADGPHAFWVRAIDARRKPGRRARRQVRGRHRGARAEDQGPEQDEDPEEKGGGDLHPEGLRAGRPPVPDRLEALRPCSERYRTPKLGTAPTPSRSRPPTAPATWARSARGSGSRGSSAPDGSAADGRRRSLQSAVSRSGRNPDRLTPR